MKTKTLSNFIFLCLIFAIAFNSYECNAASDISIIEEYWSVNGNKVSTANVGDEIEATIRIKAGSSSVQGTITIKIMQDTDVWFDEDFISEERSFILTASQEKEYTISFRPFFGYGDEIVGIFGDFKFEGYYIEVEYQAESIYKMKNEYPPRLRIYQPFWSLCVADSTISDSEEDTNAGGESYLECQDSSQDSFGSIKKSYLKFDLSALPTGSTIEKAILKLYTGFLVSSPREVGLHYCADSSWSEYEITWNNAPTYESEIIDTELVSMDSTWYGWDVSEAFETHQSLDEITFVVVSENYQEWLSASLWFESRDQEYDWMQGYKPRLAIYWSEPKPSSTISCSVTPSSGSYGDEIRISGDISPSVSIEDVEIILELPEGGSDIISTRTTDGSYVLSYVPESIGTYSVQARWDGNEAYQGDVSTVRTFSIQKASSKIDISIPSYEIIETESFHISGSLTPLFSEEIIILIFTKPDDSIYEVTEYTGANGQFSYSFIPVELGIWNVKASWNGNDYANNAESDKVTFSVIEPPPVGNIQISVQDENGNPLRSVTVISTSHPIGQEKLNAISNQDGETTFSDIRVGTYNILAEKSGYESNSETTYIIEGETTTVLIQITKQISSIKIFVKDNNANPLSDADVTSTSQPSGQQTLDGTTGSDGSVIFNDVKNGDYTFLASKNNYESKSALITVLVGETSEKTILLTELVSETEDRTGGGIPGFPVEAIILGLVVGTFLLMMFQRRR